MQYYEYSDHKVDSRGGGGSMVYDKPTCNIICISLENVDSWYSFAGLAESILSRRLFSGGKYEYA